MIARVFPKGVKWIPNDEYVFVGDPPLFIPPVDEVHVSVTFTWHRDEAERLARAWEHIAPVKIGGPAYPEPSGDFVPGMYIKKGVVITSRGCPNNCSFCVVPKREGAIRELPITDGWIVQDDNLLACSRSHFDAVIEMLKRQPERPQFTGGLDPELFTGYHASEIFSVKPEQIFFAYDTPNDWDPLVHAIGIAHDAGFTAKKIRTYVLIGYKNDTMEKAEARCQAVYDLGSYPMAMLYRDEGGKCDMGWRRLQKTWCRPAAIYANNRNS
jgi:hypothetical protein